MNKKKGKPRSNVELSLHSYITPPSSTTDLCFECGLPENNWEVHKKPLSHTFVNLPSVPTCGACGLLYKEGNHKMMSSASDTYRKPIAYRFDLIPPLALRRLAAIYEEGVKSYGESVYISKPMPHSNVVNHMINHLELFRSGDSTEDHLAKIVWGAFTLMVYQHLAIGKDNLAPYGVVPDDNTK